MIRMLLKPLSFLPALLLMYMIFSFSSQTGDVSGQLSYKVSHKIVETVNYVFDGDLQGWEVDDWANRINFITRKLAHMAEYFALAVAVAFPLYVYGLHGLLLMFVAGLICVGFACGDEYHQSFVAGRSPSVRDVLIDSFGVFWGIVLVRIVGWTGRKTIFRPKSSKKQPHFQEEYYEAPKTGFFGKKGKQRQSYGDGYGGPGPIPPGYGPYNQQGYGPQGYGPSHYGPNGYPPNYSQEFGPQDYRGAGYGPERYGNEYPPFQEPPKQKRSFFKKKQADPDHPPYEEGFPYGGQGYGSQNLPPFQQPPEDEYWQPPQDQAEDVPPEETPKKEKDWFFDDLY